MAEFTEETVMVPVAMLGGETLNVVVAQARVELPRKLKDHAESNSVWVPGDKEDKSLLAGKLKEYKYGVPEVDPF